MSRMWPPRSVLFVPGTRPDRYEKALASGADVVCVDLEDAVGPADKDAARRAVGALLGGPQWRPDRSWIRINHPETARGAADLEALLALMAGRGAICTVVVPKVGAPADLVRVRAGAAALGAEIRLVAMIETARGLEDVARIARVRGLAALFFGGADLSAELGCTMEWSSLLYARSRVVHAAALGRVQAVDVPFLDLSDQRGLEVEAAAACRLGFSGKAAIHPQQLPSIHGAFTPSREDVAQARRVLEASAAGTGGVTVVDGRMVDEPVVEAARRILARAGATTG